MIPIGGLGLAVMTATITLAGTRVLSPDASPSFQLMEARLTGTVEDPAGDAWKGSKAPVPPDLVGATLEVNSGNLTITVSYAPGTMSRTRTMFFAYLDTDENSQTGNPGVPAIGGNIDTNLIGFDFAINGISPADTGQAAVQQAAEPGRVRPVGTVPVIFPGPDQMRVVVPLTLLGGDDGRMTFKIGVFQWLSLAPPSSPVLDHMPDVGLPPGVVR